jgi:hypothetical protein
VAVLDNLAAFMESIPPPNFLQRARQCDRMGFTHVRLEQKYKSLMVRRGRASDLIVHFTRTPGPMRSMAVTADINLITRPALDAAAAVAAARQDLSAASQAAVQPVGDPNSWSLPGIAAAHGF